MTHSKGKTGFPILAAIIIMALVSGLTGGVYTEALSSDQLVVYPDYPAQITRDTDFSATVTQGAVTKSLTIYNALRAAGSTAGDDYRRFGEFAFSGGSVSVTITVNAWEIESYQILPSSYALPSTRNGNTITVTLTEPKKFMVKINGDINKMLSVFADPVELNAPKPGDPNVLYYPAGWHDVPGAILTVPENKTLYLAPGAVLNARVNVTGSNVIIKGRGMIRDGLWTAQSEPRFMITVNVGYTNVTIKDIKLLDSRFYHVGIYWWADGTVVENVKMLSNQVSTDGVMFMGNTRYNTITDCFIYNADNVFVFSSDIYPYNTVKDCIVGSTCSAFFPQGTVGESFVFKDIDVFRCTGNGDARHGLINNNYVTDIDPKIPALTFENIRAADCDYIQRLFHANHQGGTYVKRFILKNITLPEPALTYGVQIDSGCGNYELILDNVRYGDMLLTNNAQARVKDYGDPDSTFTYLNTVSTSTPAPTPLVGMIYTEDFEDYEDKDDLVARSGWVGTTTGSRGITLGSDSTKYLSVIPNQTAAYITFDPVPLKASAGQSPGANAKLIAQYRIARKLAQTGWHVFAFADRDVMVSSFNNFTNAALAAGHRPALDTDEGQWLYRSNYYKNMLPGGAEEIKGGNYLDSAEAWTTVKYVVDITDENGDFITPTADIYVDNSAVPVLSDAALLNNVDKIDKLLINGVSSVARTYYIDDIKVQVVLGEETDSTPTPAPAYITSSDENIVVDQDTKKISYPHYKTGGINYHHINTLKSKLSAANGYTFELTQSDGVTAAAGTVTEPTYKVIALYDGAAVAAYTFAAEMLYGDINGDGAVTTSDLGFLKRYLINKTGYPFEKPYGERAADINKTLVGTNTVTSADLGLLKKYLISKTQYLIQGDAVYNYDPQE